MVQWYVYMATVAPDMSSMTLLATNQYCRLLAPDYTAWREAFVCEQLAHGHCMKVEWLGDDSPAPFPLCAMPYMCSMHV